MVNRWKYKQVGASIMMSAGLLVLAVSMVGCESLLSLFPRRVTVMFVNQGDFTVDADVLIHDEQDTPEFLLNEVGTELDFSIPAGGTQSLERDCDALQVIQIDDADLRIIGGIGPETKSDVLRDGDDFRCGDTITFTFTHSTLITDFTVTANVTSGIDASNFFDE